MHGKCCKLWKESSYINFLNVYSLWGVDRMKTRNLRNHSARTEPLCLASCMRFHAPRVPHASAWLAWRNVLPENSKNLNRWQNVEAWCAAFDRRGEGRDIERVGRINFQSLSRNRMPANVTLLLVEDDGKTRAETGWGRDLREREKREDRGKDKFEITGSDETHCAAGNLGSHNNYRRTRNYILCPCGSLSSSSSSRIVFAPQHATPTEYAATCSVTFWH